MPFPTVLPAHATGTAATGAPAHRRCGQAIILAAGRGARLAPLTEKRPKCLTMVRGTPLLGLLLDRLRDVGIPEVIVVAGYRSADVRSYLASRTAPSVEVIDNPHWASSQNVLSLHLAAERVQSAFVLLDGDLWLSHSLASALCLPDRLAVAPLRPDMIGTRASVEDGLVVALGPDGGHKTVNAASFSLEWWQRWFRPLVAHMVASKDTGHFYEAAIAAALRAGAAPLTALDARDGDWFEIDTPLDLAAAETILATAGAR